MRKVSPVLAGLVATAALLTTLAACNDPNEGDHGRAQPTAVEESPVPGREIEPDGAAGTCLTEAEASEPCGEGIGDGQPLPKEEPLAEDGSVGEGVCIETGQPPASGGDCTSAPVEREERTEAQPQVLMQDPGTEEASMICGKDGTCVPAPLRAKAAPKHAIEGPR